MPLVGAPAVCLHASVISVGPAFSCLAFFLVFLDCFQVCVCVCVCVCVHLHNFTVFGPISSFRLRHFSNALYM